MTLQELKEKIKAAEVKRTDREKALDNYLVYRRRHNENINWITLMCSELTACSKDYLSELESLINEFNETNNETV